jgi:hypothetical protein
MSDAQELRWPGRVPQHKVLRLYASDAAGIRDDELLDDVGYAMLVRCEAIRTATEAHAGRAACPRCKTVIPHDGAKMATLRCISCGWQATWGESWRSYRRKQLVGGIGFPAFARFVEEWPRARTYREKLLAVDRLIHAFHHELATGKPPSRPAAINVIGGDMREVAALLDELAYRDASTPGLVDNRDEWRRTRAQSWWYRLDRARRGG